MTALADRETIEITCCDHCGCQQTDLALDASPWTLVGCRECGFVFTSPRLSDEALARIYSEEYYENAQQYAAQQVEGPSADHQLLADEVKRKTRRRSELRSMDVGCGGGRLVAAFKNAGFVASGVEPSEATVASARAAGRDVSTTDVSELPSDTFDAVTAMHVLEHVTSPSEFMTHLFRITRPGGICVIEVPNFNSKASRQQGADWYALHPSTHLSHFTPESLAACLQKAGFCVRSLSRLGGAGVFSDVSEAVVRGKSEAPSNVTSRGLFQRALSSAWRTRSVLLSIPAVRRFGRWINWELLGHGEFVRAYAIKRDES